MKSYNRFQSKADYEAHLAEQQRLAAAQKAAAVKGRHVVTPLPVQDGGVTLTSDRFVKDFARLRQGFDAGRLKKVRINEPLSGLAADFIFDRGLKTDGQRCVTTRDLRVNGVAACLGDHDNVVLLGGRRDEIMGRLSRREAIAPDLQTAADLAHVKSAKVVDRTPDYRCAATRINVLVIKWDDLKAQGMIKPGRGVPLLSGDTTPVARAWDAASGIPTTGAIDMSDVTRPDRLREVFVEHAAVRLNPWPRSKAPKNPVTPHPDNRLIITRPDFSIERGQS